VERSVRALDRVETDLFRRRAARSKDEITVVGHRAHATRRILALRLDLGGEPVIEVELRGDLFLPVHTDREMNVDGPPRVPTRKDGAAVGATRLVGFAQASANMSFWTFVVPGLHTEPVAYAEQTPSKPLCQMSTEAPAIGSQPLRTTRNDKRKGRGSARASW
jgi:hypothetical protein